MVIQGYRCRGEIFARPSDLIVWFKKCQAAANAADERNKRELDRQRAQQQGTGQQLAPSGTGRRRPSRFGEVSSQTQSSIPPPPPPPPPAPPGSSAMYRASQGSYSTYY